MQFLYWYIYCIYSVASTKCTPFFWLQQQPCKRVCVGKLGLQMRLKPKSCSNLAVHCIMSCRLVMVCMYASLTWQVRQELASLKLNHLHVSMETPLSIPAMLMILPYHISKSAIG